MGNTIAFDTHTYVKKLRKAGVDEHGKRKFRLRHWLIWRRIAWPPKEMSRN